MERRQIADIPEYAPNGKTYFKASNSMQEKKHSAPKAKRPPRPKKNLHYRHLVAGLISFLSVVAVGAVALATYYLFFIAPTKKIEAEIEALHQQAVLDKQEKNFLDAADAFAELGNYKNSLSELISCNLALAEISWSEGNAAEAYDLYRWLAEQKAVEAPVWLHETYCYLSYKARDDSLAPKSREWALWNLMNMPTTGDWMLVQSEEAAWAKDIVGVMYRYGLNGRMQDIEEALKCFQEASQSGDSYALYHLGHLYATGTGVQRDDQLALQHYDKSAKLGNSWAMLILGNMYEAGAAVLKDSELARKHFEDSARLGNEEAQQKLQQYP